jgi:poly-gamma-glutamate capsule biosynthesis protein CapA/YwtB (metallophosphatase superfamily)
MTHARRVTVFVCGDVMTGRQIDQILPHHNPAGIQERYVRDACDYVELAKPTDRFVARSTPPASGVMRSPSSGTGFQGRIINLETSITRSEEFWPDGGIQIGCTPRIWPA